MILKLINTVCSKKSYFIISVLLSLTVALQATPVFAATDPSNTDQSSSQTTPPPANPAPPPSQGTQQPTGAAAKTFHYNQDSGMWENDYYTWSPYTHQTEPKTPLIYTYNPTTTLWDITEWIYNAASGNYVAVQTSVTTPPVGARTIGSPPIASDLNNPTNNQSTDVLNGGSQSNNTFGNQINSNAMTGSADVIGNTNAGNALTGPAQTVADVMNLLQSTASLAGPNVTTFVSNIKGNVQGDLHIDPSLLQPATSQQGLSNGQVQNGQINNNIALNSTSGDATVAANTTAGNATSGSANAVANVVNIMNSAIASNKSFMGVVNIYGNLNGNILVPSQLLSSLIASNAPSTTIDTTQISSGNILDQINKQTINNHISTAATSGQASVTDNTRAGNATTGAASTNVTIFNLTGQQIVGSNSMLVFVNVLGKWVGLIMNAPTGSTAAELGGGISQDTRIATANTTNVATNKAINNNIRVSARSGSAAVSRNTNAGNATAGNATASVNLLNITNSQLSFSNWFGVLFINVFGSWMGNFGTYDNSTAVTQPSGTSPITDTTPSGAATNTVHAFRFVPNNSHGFHTVLVAATSSPTSQQVLGTATRTPSLIQTNKLDSRGVHKDHNIALLPIIASLSCLLLIAGSEIPAFRHRKQAS